MNVDSAIQKYPSHWLVTTLGRLCAQGDGDIQTGPFGSQLHAADYVDEGIPSIMPKNISVEGISTEDIAYISDEDAERLSKYLVREGDIIYSRRGDVEKCSLITVKEEGWLCGTGCLRIRLGRKSDISPVFIHAYLSHPVVREWIVRHAIGATMPNLNTSILSDVPVLIPSEDERELIESVWWNITKKIVLNRQINQTLEQIAQAIFKSWFIDFDPVKAKIRAKQNGKDPERAAMRAISGKTDKQLDQLSPDQLQPLADTAALFPDELADSELGEIPKGWDIKPLDKIADYLNGLALQKFPAKPGETTLPVIKIAQLKQGNTHGADQASSNIKSEYIIENGDVVFSWSGSLFIDIWCGGRGALNQHLFKVTSKVYPKWFYLFWTNYHLAEFQRIAADKAVTMGHIKRGHLSSARCLVPNNHSTSSLGVFIEPMVDLVVEKRLENLWLSEVRDILLPKLFSGELSLVGNEYPEEKYA